MEGGGILDALRSSRELGVWQEAVSELIEGGGADDYSAELRSFRRGWMAWRAPEDTVCKERSMT